MNLELNMKKVKSESLYNSNSSDKSNWEVVNLEDINKTLNKIIIQALKKGIEANDIKPDNLNENMHCEKVIKKKLDSFIY